MAGISDLGNGIGYIYVTDTTDTNDIKYNILNESLGARAAKLLGMQSSNIGSNLQAYGIIVVGTPSGSGNISAVNVDGVNQMKVSVSFTIASTAAEIATDIETNINNTTPGSGYNYTALAINGTVYLYAPLSAGASANGGVITVSISANLTVTTTDVDNGSTSSSTSYDESSGFRFFIDSSAGAVEGTNSGVEITDYICPKGLNSGIPVVAATIADGEVNITRVSAIQYLVVDTEGAAGTDDLDYINPIGFTIGDVIILNGTSASRVVTVTNSGNIITQGAVNFDTGNKANNIILGYTGTSWVELSKSTTAVPTAAEFRTANFPFLTSTAYGSTGLSPADNTTVTLTANSSTQRQVINSSATLTTGNYVVTCSTTGAKKGDWFLIQYDAQVTVGSYDVIIGDLTLSDADALTGGIVVIAYYEGTVWQYSHFKDFGSYAKVQTADYAADSITVAKVEDNLKYEVIVFPVSFNPGETAQNKIEMPYSGTVSKMTAYSTSIIGDDSTITPKNNTGTVMGSGTITFSASDPVNTGYTSTPSTNNTFVAGDILEFLTQTSTLGSGTALVSVKITRS